MLQRDYFIRMIEEFTAAVTRFLHNNQDEKRKDDELKDLYRQYVGPFDVVRNLSFDELLVYAQEQWSDEQRLERLGFVAELLYLESSYKLNPLRAMLMEKAFQVYSYLDANSDVMSIDRSIKMASIKKELNI